MGDPLPLWCLTVRLTHAVCLSLAGVASQQLALVPEAGVQLRRSWRRGGSSLLGRPAAHAAPHALCKRQLQHSHLFVGHLCQRQRHYACGGRAQAADHSPQVKGSC